MPPIKLDAPASTHTVRVRMVDTTAVMVLHAKSFIEPMISGHNTMNATDVAFLIENDRLQKKAMFDLGTRKDFWNLPPSIQKRFEKIAASMKVPQDVKDVLEEKQIALGSINDIIWSHSHWDHTGDTTLFPPSTNLVYGPEVSTSKPGYPDNPKSPLPNSLFQGRKNIEITFPPDGLHIGGLAAHDFYGDGSLYLLSTPGHAKGHLCALARTTPDTFILMGGDACHFCGTMRPNKGYPLPDPIPDGVLDQNAAFPHPCPASFFLDEHPQCTNKAQQSITNAEDVVMTPKEARRHGLSNLLQKSGSPSAKDASTTPYYALSTDAHTVYDTPDPQTAQATVDTLIENFDGASNVLVALAHDTALLEHLPTLNSRPEEDLNGWFANGWKEKCYWGWLNEVARKGQQGREKVVDGWWIEERRFESAKELLDEVGREDGKGRGGSEKL